MKNQNLISLQILRCIASTSVVYFHVGCATNKISFGSFGVDIFFVLSGFIMAMITSQNREPAVFAINRISRVAPMYWVITSFLIISSFLYKEKGTGIINFENSLKSLFFIPYLRPDGTVYPILAPGWTINYEMFFYIVILFSFFLPVKISALSSSGLLVAAFLFSRYTDNSLLQAFFGNSIIFEFIIGILTYYAFRHYHPIKIRPSILIVLILVCYASLVLAELNQGFNLPRFVAFGPLSAVFLVGLIWLEEEIRMKSSFMYRALAKMGDASFATYLTHSILLKFIFDAKSGQNYSALYVVATIAAILLFGQLAYYFIDLPLSKYTRGKLLGFYYKI